MHLPGKQGTAQDEAVKLTSYAGDIARYLMLVACCFILGGCAFNLPLPGLSESRVRLGLLSNRIDTGFGDSPKAVKEVTDVQGRGYDFVFYPVAENGQICLTAHNRREAPVTVTVEMIRADNVATDRSFPFEYVVPPNTRLCVARIQSLYKNRDLTFQYSSSWMIGDLNARHNPRDGYRLPWQQGESYPVGQAYGGPLTTHTERSSQFAVDFSMPQGTTVLAARSGTVVNLADSFGVGAIDKVFADKANFVDILHDDGTIATYAHLAERGVTVRLGQKVSVGEKLGISGSTGFSSGPHLHFVVWRPEKGWKGLEQVSIPVEFCIDGVPCAPVTSGATIPNRPKAAKTGTGATRP